MFVFVIPTLVQARVGRVKWMVLVSMYTYICLRKDLVKVIFVAVHLFSKLDDVSAITNSSDSAQIVIILIILSSNLIVCPFDHTCDTIWDNDTTATTRYLLFCSVTRSEERGTEKQGTFQRDTTS